jgi:hypothetical protein
VSLGKESVAAEAFDKLARKITERVAEVAKAEKPVFEIR